MTEMEVLPHHHESSIEPFDQLPGDEFFCRLVGPLLVEVDHHRAIDPGGCQQFELLVEVAQQQRSRLRTNHCGGVPIERHHHGGQSALLGPRPKFGK